MTLVKMSDAPVQGTSIDDIESGQVENEADDARMREIMEDMNVDETANSETPMMQHREMPPPQRMSQMRNQLPAVPMYSAHMEMNNMYEEEEPQQQQPKYRRVNTNKVVTPKKNTWSTVLETVRDPVFVTLLLCLLLLPAVHTLAGKHLAWAFKVGGELSWAGLAFFSIIGGLLFGLYQYGMKMAGL